MTLQQTLRIALEAFCLTSVIVPTVWVNKAIYVLIIILYCLVPRWRVKSYSPIILVAVFLYGGMVAALSLQQHENVNKWLLSSLVGLLAFPIWQARLDMTGVARRVGTVASAIIIGSGALDLTGLDQLVPFNFWEEFWNYSLGTRTVKSYLGLDFMSYSIGGTPVLILSSLIVVHELGAKSLSTNRVLLRLAQLALMLTATIISGSRGVMLTTWLGLFCIALIRFGVIVKVLVLLFAFFSNFAIVNTLLRQTVALSVDEFSNQVKVGHIQSFWNQLNIKELLVGNGVGAYYYSSGVGAEISHTEITPLDMVRFFGLFGSIVLYAAVLLPCLRRENYSGKSWVITLFVLYLINSFTNPTMFNSAGMVVVLWYWAEIFAPAAGNSTANSWREQATGRLIKG